ncbi:hypothetical protein JCM10207_003097 [Rhodosporidiobolus poonsookiae]
MSLRTAARALFASPSQLSLPRSLARALSTEATPAPAQQQKENPHQAQRQARTRSLRRVTEEGGATAKLVQLAVNNSANAELANNALGGQAQRRTPRFGARPQQPREEGDAPASFPRRPHPRQPRSDGQQQSREGGEGSEARPFLAYRRRQQGGANGPSSSLGSSLSSRRADFSPEARALRTGGGAASRFAPRGAGGPGARPPARGPPRPRVQRPRQSGASADSAWSKADTDPLDVPSDVRVPKANLVQLLRAHHASKQREVKAAVGAGVDVNAEKQEDRERARQVLGGDYSAWAEAGKEIAKAEKGKGKALEHARGILTLNPSVSIAGRAALLNKVKEALV